MKKLCFILVIIAATAFTATSQVFFLEDFFDGVPPAGWNIDAHAENWYVNGSANAGGTTPEARFSWSPSFVGDSRLISLPVDLTGFTMVKYSFNHLIEDYSGDYTVGVATRSGGGEWTSVWEIVDPSGGVEAEEVEITITNSDVGQTDFEICFYFSGDSYNIGNWYIDNAKLYYPYDHDVATEIIFGDTYFDQGDNYEASALIANKGLNTETFDVVIDIVDVATNELSFSDTISVSSLEPGTNTTVNFAGYTLPNSNILYEVFISTHLDGDIDPDNDMKTKYIYTYTSEREMVVVEIATGTWCGFCPGAAMGADDLIANGKSCAIIEHHGTDDYATDDSEARIDYYGIDGLPTAFFDGTLEFPGGTANQSIYSYYLPLYEERIVIRSAYSLSINGGIVADEDYTILVVVEKLAYALNENVVLHVVLTESEIPEMWGGLDHLNFVNRLMMPDVNGTVVDVTSNTPIEVEHSFTIDPSWDVNHCELVYFLQDTDTKEILQAGKVMVNDLIPVGIDEAIEEKSIMVSNNYPNPFSTSTTISYYLQQVSVVNLEIYNMQGQVVRNLVNTKKQSGDHKIVWDGTTNTGQKVDDGVYFCKISVIPFEGKRCFTNMQKMVVMRKR